jgi:hypothetical protein
MGAMRFWLGFAAAALIAAGAPAATPAGNGLARLTTQVERAEAVRAIKRLQAAYAHYLQLGMWDEVTKLYARDGELMWGDSVSKGHDAIAANYVKSMGHGGQGLAPGRLIMILDMAPVVTLSPDGKSGKGRWHELSVEAEYKKGATWGGGIHENEYVLEDGVWKIARLHYYPTFAGPYQTGWRNTSANPKTVPFHYTPEEASTPSIALASGAALAKAAPAPALAARIQLLNDEAEVQRLQNAYGFYVDRRMWDDVADLFAPAGTLESAEGPRIAGRAAIRAQLEKVAPANLKPGELNDHLQLDTLVTVDPGGQTAHARGADYGMVGKNGGEAYWSLAVFENDYVKKDGTWMVAAMRLYPRAKTDFYKGWAESAVPDYPLAPAGEAVAPSRLQYPAEAFPAISFRNPVTGAKPVYPASLQILPIDWKSSPARAPAPSEALPVLERNLWRAAAYDGAENVSTAYGYYIDEFEWSSMARLFAEKGWKELSYIGVYVGRDRVLESIYQRYGKGDGRKGAGLAIHQKVQPVTTVAPDGKSAHIHLHLFQLGSAPAASSAQIGGIYENKVILEKGLWQIAAMDLDYVWTSSNDNGWGKVEAGASRRFAPQANALAKYPPDRPLRGPSYAPYPEMEPILFHYRNPVSGRKPPLLLEE